MTFAPWYFFVSPSIRSWCRGLRVTNIITPTQHGVPEMIRLGPKGPCSLLPHRRTLETGIDLYRSDSGPHALLIVKSEGCLCCSSIFFPTYNPVCFCPSCQLRRFNQQARVVPMFLGGGRGPSNSLYLMPVIKNHRLLLSLKFGVVLVVAVIPVFGQGNILICCCESVLLLLIGRLRQRRLPPPMILGIFDHHKSTSQDP